MLPAHVEIVGIQNVFLNEGRLFVTLALSDGSTCSSWWGDEDLRRFMSITSPPTKTPLGAALQ